MFENSFDSGANSGPTGRAGVVFLPSIDLEQTREFWTRVLGAELALDQGTCLIFRLGGTGFVGFCASDDSLVGAGRTIITFVRDDVDNAFHQMVSAGAPVDGLPRLNPKYRIYHFFVNDPMGYRIEVQRFDDPRWPRS